MIRKTFLWAILGLLACAGLASESQASLVAQGNATSVATPGGNVTVNWAVFDKDGGGYGTGNATVEAAAVGGSNFLYLYQVSSTNDFIHQIAIQSQPAVANFLPLVATGPFVVNGVIMDASILNSVTFVAGGTRVTTPSTTANQILGQFPAADPPNASAIVAFTSAYGPELLGRLAAQADADGTNVRFDVDIPVKTSDVPPPVPEPGTLLLSAIALVGGFAMRRRLVVA